MHDVLRNLGRSILTALLVFEFLNLIKIFHFTLDFTWLGLMLTSALTLIIIEIISYCSNKNTSEPLLGIVYFMASVSVFLDAMSDIFHFYSRFWFTDNILHFLGGGCMALVFFSVIKAYINAGKIKLGSFSHIFFSICIASFMGTIYEIEEYSESYFFHTDRLGDGFDTANDLFMNNLGAIIFCVIVYFYISRRKIPKKIKYAISKQKIKR